MKSTTRMLTFSAMMRSPTSKVGSMDFDGIKRSSTANHLNMVDSTHVFVVLTGLLNLRLSQRDGKVLTSASSLASFTMDVEVAPKSLALADVTKLIDEGIEEDAGELFQSAMAEKTLKDSWHGSHLKA